MIQQGGEIGTASTDVEMEGRLIACVGHLVRYSNGNET
jgi:hypothetical protein